MDNLLKHVRYIDLVILLYVYNIVEGIVKKPYINGEENLLFGTV